MWGFCVKRRPPAAIAASAGYGRRLAQTLDGGTNSVAQRHQILIVAETTALAQKLRVWLNARGYWTTVVGTYAAAKFHLEMQPSMAIAELRLGEYNGLQLAVRASSHHVPILVVGDRDQFFEHEAEQLGASYLAVDDLGPERIVSCVERQLALAAAH